jgi:hypothetical protein
VSPSTLSIVTEPQEVEEVGGDGLLRMFAKLVQEVDAEIGITLNVGGACVTGRLVGRDKWLEAFASWTEEEGELAGTIGRSLQRALERADLEDPISDEVPYRFLHLKDAFLVSGDGLMPTSGRGALWRGRISQVSGWSLGNLAASR